MSLYPNTWLNAKHDQAFAPIRMSSRFELPLGGISIKTLSLVLLVLQNSLLIMIMRYSRTSGTGPRYVVSTAVLLVEVVKLFASLGLATRDILLTHAAKYGPNAPPARTADIVAALYRTICSRDAWKNVIPAGLYTLQNYLVYVAVSNMDTVSFQVTYQLKILTTVLFSILLLGRAVSPRQWFALVLLALGVAVVQAAEALNLRGLSVVASAVPAIAKVLRYPVLSAFQQDEADAAEGYDVLIAATAPASSFAPAATVIAVTATNSSKGLLAALAAATISGLTCVYFEKLVKDSLAYVSLWTRNVQLSFFSLFPAMLLGVLWQDGAAIARDGFFAGYGPAVWATIALQALGGLLVAVCITYADNVAKNFAASLSIAVCSAAGVAMGWESLTVNSTAGTSLVLLAIYIFQFKTSAPTKVLLPLSKEREEEDDRDSLDMGILGQKR